MVYNFGEKQEEFSAKQGKNIPVWQSPKYLESRNKAIEIIESGKYGLDTSDFWILMNETKSGKMAYTGLIISHNACLKINDCMSDKFKPSCVTIDKEGYHETLVYTYSNDTQGVYEVGEVSASNCKNAYPYAMAFKRLFDRVVLKISKIAYSGVYSEAEADEFRNLNEEYANVSKNAPATKPKQEKSKAKPANDEVKNAALNVQMANGTTFQKALAGKSKSACITLLEMIMSDENESHTVQAAAKVLRDSIR